MDFQSPEIKWHLFPLIDPKKKARLRNGEDRDEKEHGLESGRNPHARLQVGVRQCLSLKILLWAVLFFPVCVALWNWAFGGLS